MSGWAFAAGLTIGFGGGLMIGLMFYIVASHRRNDWRDDTVRNLKTDDMITYSESVSRSAETDYDDPSESWRNN